MVLQNKQICNLNYSNTIFTLMEYHIIEIADLHQIIDSHLQSATKMEIRTLRTGQDMDDMDKSWPC